MFARQTFLAGSDARRQGELREALDDPTVAAILTARGGHGATRIVSSISASDVRRANKPLFGFSDVTALHALWRSAGVPSVHSPMVAWLGTHEDARADFLDALNGKFSSHRLIPVEGHDVTHETELVGELVGGNLAVLAALSGTPNALRADEALLVLEDVGEAPYRIDRALTQLRVSGSLEGVRAVVLGTFCGADKSAYGATLVDVMRDHFRCPIFRGLQMGHTDANRCLPLGVRAEIVNDELRIK